MMALKQYFHQHFSNELGTICVTSRSGIMSAIYKKGDKRDIENYRPILFLNLKLQFLNYKIYATILNN